MLKRTPLERRTELKQGTKQLKRTGSLPRKRKAPRRGRERDESHLAFIRTLRCSACDREPPSHAHHETSGRGMGQKADDWRAFALCLECHDDFHGGRCRFKGWDKDQRRAWQMEQVALVLIARLEAMKGIAR